MPATSKKKAVATKKAGAKRTAAKAPAKKAAVKVKAGGKTAAKPRASAKAKAALPEAVPVEAAERVIPESTRQMIAAAAAACEDKKAEDTRILELDALDAGFTDFFLITSGANERQTQSIADEVEARLKREFGTYPNSVEGKRQGEWILLDYVDFVVHIFLAEKRAFYDIERLRKSAKTMSLNDLQSAFRTSLKRGRGRLRT